MGTPIVPPHTLATGLTPFLQIIAGGQCFQITDAAVKTIYIGTNPLPLETIKDCGVATIIFSQLEPVGAMLHQREDGGWLIVPTDGSPTEGSAFTLIDGAGVTHSMIYYLRGKLPAGNTSKLTEGLNRLLFDAEEVQILVPFRSGPRLLRAGEIVPIASMYERAHIVVMPPKKKTLVIGRKSKEGADYLIEHSGVSARHAAISRDENGDYWVEDLHSANGTFLRNIWLVPGQRHRIRLGQLFYVGSAPVVLLDSELLKDPQPD